MCHEWICCYDRVCEVGLPFVNKILRLIVLIKCLSNCDIYKSWGPWQPGKVAAPFPEMLSLVRFCFVVRQDLV